MGVVLIREAWNRKPCQSTDVHRSRVIEMNIVIKLATSLTRDVKNLQTSGRQTPPWLCQGESLTKQWTYGLA